ncbi:MAG: aromatic ring-hydroxylating dioxygenase subunit alpha [Gammaproteobacteria bacterium]|nr:aromatic ring-hydroxylating dioxygenase subunit alpha [Gammaproteobacteria bacterium]MDH3535392.1 aromatic ring-hydroxylating dioxygenase subunit alpha [Gammaproteobacteria bacterium]
MSRQPNGVLSPTFRKTLRSIRGANYDRGFSLPGSFYTDPLWLQTECRELFLKDWFCVGRVEEVAKAGDFFSFDQIGEPILVVHGSDGVIRALSNVCRHRGTVIASGSGNTKKFLCPYHHWAYDTTGQLLNAPHMESHQAFNLKQCRLPELKCEFWQGFIFVNLNPRAPALARELAPLETVIKNYHLEQMSLGYLADEVWDTNWKCLLENFMEGYHLTPLHRETLHKVNPSRLCTHLQPGKRHFGYSVGFTSRLPADRIGHPDLSDREMDTCVMFAVPPGLTVGIGSDYSSFLCLRPLNTSQVSVKMGLIFHGDHWSRRDIDNAIELFQHTMDEDKQVLVRLQQGLGSRFHRPGPLAGPDLEGTIWDFYQYLSRKLGPRQKAVKN